MSANNVLADGPSGLPLRTTRLYAKSEGRDAEGLPAMVAVYRGSFGCFADLSSRILGRVCCSLSIGFSWDAVQVQVCVSRAVDIFLCHTTQLLNAGFPSAVAVAWCSGAGIRYDFFDCVFDWMGWVFRLRTAQRLFVGPVPRRVLAAKYDAFSGACLALNRVLVLVWI